MTEMEDHDCEKNECTPPAHLDEYGPCMNCGGCGDPECCLHDEECYDDRTYPLPREAD